MNKKIQKILACVDASDYAPMVLEYAVELVKDSHIVVYNVINQRDVDMVGAINREMPGKIDVEEYVNNLKKERERMIKDLINNHFFKQKSRMSFIIEVGIPSLQILQVVETEDIDLIVMANKGTGNIERVLFGSAAEKVFRHSPVPVLSVRDRKIFKRGR